MRSIISIAPNKLTPRYYFLLINLAIAENATNQSAAAEATFQGSAANGAVCIPIVTFTMRVTLLAHTRAPSEARQRFSTAPWS